MSRLRGHVATTGLACGIALLLGACGTAAPSASLSTAPASPASSEFTSALYGYVLSLPEGWRPEPATEAWDGDPDDFGSESATSDRFHGGSGETIWAVGAPTTRTVDDMIEEQTAADVVNHDCDAVPDTDEEITIGGEPARLTTKNCAAGSETVIATAAVVHGEDGFLFYFIHPETLAPNPDAIDAFTDFLAGVTFPD